MYRIDIFKLIHFKWKLRYALILRRSYYVSHSQTLDRQSWYNSFLCKEWKNVFTYFDLACLFDHQGTRLTFRCDLISAWKANSRWIKFGVFITYQRQKIKIRIVCLKIWTAGLGQGIRSYKSISRNRKQLYMLYVISNVCGVVKNCQILIVNSSRWQIEKTFDRTSQTSWFWGRDASVLRFSAALTRTPFNNLQLLFDIKEAFCKKYFQQWLLLNLTPFLHQHIDN